METFQLNWDSHEKNISEAFNSLRKDEHFCDVTLVCEERQFQAHKVVLLAGNLIVEVNCVDLDHSYPHIYFCSF